MNPWDEGWFWVDSSALHLLCILFLLVLYQLHLRASGIRSRRLGPPALGDGRLNKAQGVGVICLEPKRKKSVFRPPGSWFSALSQHRGRNGTLTPRTASFILTPDP